MNHQYSLFDTILPQVIVVRSDSNCEKMESSRRLGQSVRVLYMCGRIQCTIGVQV